MSAEIIRENDTVIVRGQIRGTVEEIATSNGLPTKYKVRVTAGQHAAGSLMWVVPSEIEHEEQNPTDFGEFPEQETQNNWETDNPWEPEETTADKIIRFISENRSKVLMLFVVVALAVSALEYTRTEPVEPTQIIKDTHELNQINLLDSKDLEIKRSAQGRIDERKPRKDQLLKDIGYGK